MFTKLFNQLKEKLMEPTKEELEKMTAVERYKFYRKGMEKHFDDEKIKKSEEKLSPSGKYKLVLSYYGTKKGCWDYSRGRVYEGGKLVADVKRNYHHFPFAWAEGHPNGHDYLLCGEDYQGYTVLELDTGMRNDLLPESYKKAYSYKSESGEMKTGYVDVHPNGYGFCWAGIHPSPDKKVLAIDGCYWAAPYEVLLLDFSEPMQLPYWELERWEDCESFDTWETEGKLLLSRTVEVRKSDKKLIDDIPEEEWPPESEWEDLKLTKVWEPKSLPASRSAVAKKEYERLLRKLFEVGTQSEAADVIRDLMDRPGYALSEEDKLEMAKLSHKLGLEEAAREGKPMEVHYEAR